MKLVSIGEAEKSCAKANYKFDGNKVFFTSDTHFYHGNIIRFCNRPFKDVDMMNETIISNWNNTIGQDDIVFHLGDFCLGGSAEWTKILDRLNGKIYLIMGNHDLKNIRQGYIDRFEHVAMQMHIEIGKQRIYLNHYPFLCFDGGYKNDVWQLSGMFTQGKTTPELMLPGFNISIQHNTMSELITTTLPLFHFNK